MGVTINMSGDLQRLRSVRDLVGNTPMLRLARTGEADGAPIFVKLENYNPSGSMRDRYVQEIIERAMLAGQLQAGDAVAVAGIDDSSVAAALVARTLQLDLRVFAPNGSSRRLLPLIERWGGVVEWTPDEDGLQGAIAQAADWARPQPDRFYVDGFRRLAVRDAYRAMAQEILRSLGGRPLGAFITSVTTGGTFCAVSAELLQEHPTLQVAGVHILENEYASPNLPDNVTDITLAETWEWRDRLAREEGLLLGPKGAACLKVAVELQKVLSPECAIVTLNPDAGHRYLGWESKSLFRATMAQAQGI